MMKMQSMMENGKFCPNSEGKNPKSEGKQKPGPSGPGPGYTSAGEKYLPQVEPKVSTVPHSAGTPRNAPESVPTPYGHRLYSIYYSKTSPVSESTIEA